MKKYLKRVRDFVFGRQRDGIPEDEFDEAIPLPDPMPTIPRETLNPAIVLQQEDALPAIKREAEKLAAEYRPGIMMREIFSSIADMFAELWKEYREFASVKLENALEAFRSAETPAVIHVDPETEELKASFRSLAEKRLNAIDMLYEKAAKATAAFRRLCVGITGNPAILPTLAEVGLAFVLPVVAAITGSMLFEVVFNAPLLQDKANLDVAQMFSVLVSLAGTIVTFMAGRSMRFLLDHQNAVTEWHSCFPDGKDSETGRPAAEVFPMAGDTTFERRFWHSAMFFVISTTLIIRYIMASQVGDMAGSAGVIFVFVVLYGYEAKFARINHPRAQECLAKKAEAEETETELVALKGEIASSEAKKLFDEYVSSLAERETAERAKAEARKQAADSFVYLANGFLASPEWLVEKFRKILGEVAEVVGDERTETDDELTALTVEVEPEFSTFDLATEITAATSTSTNVEIRGRRISATEFDNFLVKLTDELIRERAATKVAAAEEESRRATAKAAMPAPKLTRPRWTPPRLGGERP